MAMNLAVCFNRYQPFNMIYLFP